MLILNTQLTYKGQKCDIMKFYEWYSNLIHE